MSVAIGERDTIAAISTATGPGAIGIVRISGPKAAAILERSVGPTPGASPRRLVQATARDAAGEPIDDVLAVFMPGPASFTGEDVAELHGHGGAVSLGRLLGSVLDGGARQAEAGEFTRRAFENGRIDLTEAEGILAVIEAAGERARRVGQALLRGELRQRIDALRGRVNEVLAELEAHIDFPEDDLDPGAAADVVTRLEAIAVAIEGLAATAASGQMVVEGVTVALVGPVNAGKSSLFNRLIGRERALVAPEPGTTRDYVEATVQWSGLAVTLIDTAGVRERADGLEARGIELGERRAREADFELVIVEAREWVAGARPDPGDRRLLAVSKADVADKSDIEVGGTGAVVTSAVSGRGIEEVRQAIVGAAVGGVERESVLVVNERQARGLRAALECLRRGLESRRTHGPPELAAADLREALRELATVVGEEVGDEMLDALFARFCIGK